VKATQNERFHLIENSNSNLIFDIQTNRVYKMEGDGAKIIENFCRSFNGFHECNRDALQKAAYEDGSNLALNLNLTPLCNLKCVYCFAQGGDYGGLEKPMGQDVVTEIASLIQNYRAPSQKVRFEFFGGEPLLNFEVMQKVVDFSKTFSRENSVEFIYRVSTNLTYVNQEIIDLLGKNNFIISVSIDGCKAVQDRLRPFKDGRGSFEPLMENLQAIREQFPDVIIVARMTIAQKQIELIANIQNLIETDLFDYVSIYPASVKDERQHKYHYFCDAEIKRQIQEVLFKYAELFQVSSRFKGILEFEKIYDQLFNGKLSVSHCAAGGTYFTISGDQSVAPCHRMCGKKEFILNSNSDQLDDTMMRQWSEKVDQHRECSQCWIRYICGGGCKQEHYSANGSIKLINRDSCDYQCFLVENIIKSLEWLPSDFKLKARHLDDLFIYCGRPTVLNKREAIPSQVQECFELLT
jgi:uncharacterized protein